MFKEERYDKILKIIEQENYISADDLSRKLYVSLPTVRRDLAELHRRGQIIRSRGGAKKVNTENIVMPLNFRKTLNLPQKRKLCEAAAALIKENSLIFIDASSTVMQIADFITGNNSVTVVTNGIPLSVALSKKGIKTYCTGGEIQGQSLGFAGSYAEQFIAGFNFDVCFFSSKGVTEDGMIVDTSGPENMLRKAALRHSKKSVFLCDATKLNLTAPFNLAHISDISCVVTDHLEIASKSYDIKKDIITVK